MTDEYVKKNVSFEYIDEACHILTRSFIETNNIYKWFGARYEEIYPIVKH
jgi:hypothetical protein